MASGQPGHGAGDACAIAASNHPRFSTRLPVGPLRGSPWPMAPISCRRRGAPSPGGGGGPSSTANTRAMQ
eukprot:1125535-Pyramimonas_sp.AAC.1